MTQVEETKSKIFTYEGAYRSGKGGFRIKADRMRGNPFKDSVLAEAWNKGWLDAAAVEPMLTKRTSYAESEDRNDRHPRSRGRSNSYRPPRDGK